MLGRTGLAPDIVGVLQHPADQPLAFLDGGCRTAGLLHGHGFQQLAGSQRLFLEEAGEVVALAAQGTD